MEQRQFTERVLHPRNFFILSFFKGGSGGQHQPKHPSEKACGQGEKRSKRLLIMKITPIKLNFALRCTFCVPLIAIVCFAATQPAEADQIVNVAASTYGDPASGLSTLNIFEPAGTYTITEVDPGTPGATYTAWDPIGFNNSSTWVNTLWVFEGSAGNEIKIATLGSGTVFSSPQAAFSDPNNQPVTVTLTSPGYLDFGVDDNYLPDNLGGISADIHAVPEYSSNIILIGILLPVILYSVQAKRDKKIQETCP